MSKYTYHALRFQGRLFVKDALLYLVLDVDPETGTTRASCKPGEFTEFHEFSLAEVSSLIAKSGHLILDGLNAQKTAKRIFERDEAWYFQSREGEQGPYDTAAKASAALKKHILNAQEQGDLGPGRESAEPLAEVS